LSPAQQIGRCALEIVIGNERARLTLEIFPTKLDYESDYETILHDLTSVGHGLILEFLRATYKLVGQGMSRPSSLDWLTQLRHLITDVEKAVHFINSRPFPSLTRTTGYVRPEDVRNIDAGLALAIAHGGGIGDFRNTPIGSLRAFLPSRKAEETLDTLEHRWIRRELVRARDLLWAVSKALAAEQLLSLRRGWSAARLRQETAEVDTLLKRVAAMLGLPVIARASPSLHFADFSSQTLLNAPGYSLIYRSCMALRHALSVNAGPVAASMKDLDLLYEMWCFVAVAKILSEVTHSTFDLSKLISVESGGLRVKLARGSESSLTCNAKDRRITLAYNRQYPTATGGQRPDIICEVVFDNWPELVIVLDAKYRLDVSDEHLRSYESPGPPIDAVNALHRYRDAIVVQKVSLGLGRPVIKGIALFPLAGEAARTFTTTSLYKSLSIVGIGAVPFLPSSAGIFKAWLSELLQLTPTMMAAAGPTFLGEAHARDVTP